MENHPLALTSSGTTIPDTSCDPATPCSTSSSNVWNSSDAYGFGYNASGVGTTTLFPDLTYYRPFATSGNVFMSENAPAKNRTATITYKVNIPGTQAAGKYENSVIFVAVPKY